MNDLASGTAATVRIARPQTFFVCGVGAVPCGAIAMEQDSLKEKKSGTDEERLRAQEMKGQDAPHKKKKKKR